MRKVLYPLIALLFIILFYTISDQNRSGKSITESGGKVVIYSKAYCFYCENAKMLLKRKNVAYKEIELTNNQQLHEKLLGETGQSTVPYVFIQGKFVGGYSDLEQLESDGKLDPLLGAEVESMK